MSRISLAVLVSLSCPLPGEPAGTDTFEQALRGARVRVRAGDLDGARARYEAILSGLAPAAVDASREAIVLDELATVHFQKGDLAGAVPLLERQLAIRRGALSRDEAGRGVCLNNLAQVHRMLGHDLEAERLFQESLAIAQRSGGATLAHRLVALGALYEREGKMAKARACYQEADSAIDQCPPAQRPMDVLVDCLRGLANANLAQKRLDSAQDALERYVEIQRRLRGADDPAVAMGLESLGIVLDLRDHSREALETLDRALAAWTLRFGRQDPHLLGCLAKLVAVTRRARMDAQALDYCKRAHAIAGKTFGADSLEVVPILTTAAELSASLRRYADAERIFARGVEIMRKRLKGAEPRVAIGLDHLATVLTLEGKSARAEEIYRQALATFKAIGGLSGDDGLRSIKGYAQLLRTMHKTEKAAKLEAWAQAAQAHARALQRS